jgi:hypothetical protein
MPIRKGQSAEGIEVTIANVKSAQDAVQVMEIILN